MPEKKLNNQTEPNNEPDTEVLDFNNPSYKFIPSGYHDWKQQGPYLICFSCELQHAVRIGVEKLMVGKDEKGQPILKTRKDLGMD